MSKYDKFGIIGEEFVIVFYCLIIQILCKDINLILNNANHDLIEKDKINVLWMHHLVNQKEAQNLRFKDFVNKLDWIVYNSNWNLEKHIYQFRVPESKCIVIKNAIEKINFEEKPKDKECLSFCNRLR